MKIQAQKDFYAGLLFIAFGTVALIVAQNYSLGTAAKFGAGMFPFLASCGLIAVGVVVTLQGIATQGTGIDAVGPVQLAMPILAIIIFSLTIETFGLVLASLLCIGLARLSDAESRARIMETLLLAIGLSVAAVLLFKVALGLSLRVWPEWL